MRLGDRGGEKIGIDKIVALDDLAGKYGNGTREDWAGEGEGVELSAFAAGVDRGGQIGEEFGVEGAAGEGGIEVARVNTGEMRAEACGDHLASEFGGGDAERRAPDGEDGFEAGSGEFLDAVSADVLEEEVAEGDSVEAFGGSAGADLGHPRLVVGVGAGEGKIDLPERQADGSGLPVEKFFAEAVDGDAAELLVEGGEEGDDLVLRLPAEEMEGPGAVFSAAPTEQDALWGGTGLAILDRRRHWLTPLPPIRKS